MEDSLDRSLSPSVEETESFLVIPYSEDESTEINENIIIMVPRIASSRNISRSVTPSRFICKDTIEERITQLQEKKLELAQSVLSSKKNSATSKLMFDDLKSLFAF